MPKFLQPLQKLGKLKPSRILLFPTILQIVRLCHFLMEEFFESFADESFSLLSRMGNHFAPSFMDVAITLHKLEFPCSNIRGGRFERPFDANLRDKLFHTSRNIMTDSGLEIPLIHVGYPEITMLVRRPTLKSSELKVRLSSMASSYLSLKLNEPTIFQCSITLLPTQSIAANFFEWLSLREEDKAQNAYCKWALTLSGVGSKDVMEQLEGMTLESKQSLLSTHNINLSEVPSWQRHGIVLYREPTPGKQYPYRIEADYDMKANMLHQTLLKVLE